MFKNLLSTLKKMLMIMFHPQEFKKMNKDELNLLPFGCALIILLICSVFMSYRIVGMAKEIIANPSNYSLTTDQMSTVTEISGLSVTAYAVTLMTSAFFSMMYISLLMYAVGKIFKMDIKLRSSLSIISYAWIPMIFSTVIVTILVYFVPTRIAMFSSNILGFFVDPINRSNIAYMIADKIDVFYIWTLIIVGYAFSCFYQNKVKWIVFIAVLFGAPIIYSIIKVF